MEKTCIECDKTFDVTKCTENAKYCSRKCYFNGKISGKTNTKKRVNKICLQCNKTFEVTKCREGAKYCTNNCIQIRIFKEEDLIRIVCNVIKFLR